MAQQVRAVITRAREQILRHIGVTGRALRRARDSFEVQDRRRTRAAIHVEEAEARHIKAQANLEVNDAGWRKMGSKPPPA